MKKYEAVFILDERKVDDGGKGFAEEVVKFIVGHGGEMIETVPMGRKQFAREIRRRKAGIYWDFVFAMPPDQAIAIRPQFRLDERILRMQVFNYDRPEMPPPETAAAAGAPIPAVP